MDKSIEDLVDDSIVSDEGLILAEDSEFSVDTCPRDCVSVNWWDPIYKDTGGHCKSGCPDKLCVGDLEKQNGTYIIGDEPDGKLVIWVQMNGKEPAQVKWTKRFAPFKTQTITRPTKI